MLTACIAGATNRTRDLAVAPRYGSFKALPPWVGRDLLPTCLDDARLVTHICLGAAIEKETSPMRRTNGSLFRQRH